eukprot:7166844-Ditylum_brightwellii.AAC.1
MIEHISNNAPLDNLQLWFSSIVHGRDSSNKNIGTCKTADIADMTEANFQLRSLGAIIKVIAKKVIHTIAPVIRELMKNV